MPKRLLGTENRHSLSNNQVQAAGLVETFGPAWAGRAQVAFVNQPDLGARKVGPRHRMADQLLQEMLHRLLVSNVQEYLRGQVRVEPTVIGWFHWRITLPQPDGAFNSKRHDFSGVRFCDPVQTIG
jgi:hypothetical protein